MENGTYFLLFVPRIPGNSQESIVPISMNESKEFTGIIENYSGQQIITVRKKKETKK